MKTHIDELVESNPIKITLSNKADKASEFEKIKINKIDSKKGELYQIESYTKTQVFHKNIENNELFEELIGLIPSFKQINSFGKDFDFEIKVSKKGKIFASKKKSNPESIKVKDHNKKKKYILEEGMDIPALKDLGIFSKEGKIINSKYDKYKQINRFIEIIDDEIRKIEEQFAENPNKTLNILDFGCGKSYLTFILYHYFTVIKKININVIGLDLKQDVINHCNKIAKKYNYENLRFEIGDINGFNYDGELDMVISLHACNTATDYALFNAVNWGAKMIFSVPCCQHEVNEQINPQNLKIISKYGIIQERISALFTDSIRASLLEYLGYKTQVLEFIDISHSPKNLLIRASKSNIDMNKRKISLEEVEKMLEEFKIEQTFYKLLKESGKI